MKRFALCSCVLLCFMFTGCNFKGCSKEAEPAPQEEATVSDNKPDFVTVSLENNKEKEGTVVDAAEVYPSGVVDLPDIESAHFAKAESYKNYVPDTDAPYEKDDRGYVEFRLNDINFQYTQNIDLQLLTGDDSSFYLRGLDDKGSYVAVTLYQGEEYSSDFDLVKMGGFGLFDLNGNTYYIAQNPSNTLWYYVFSEDEDAKMVVIEKSGDMSVSYLNVFLDLPALYQ